MWIEYIITKFVYSENYSLIRLFRVQLSLIRGDFECTVVWSGVTFERTIVWSEVILSAQSSGRWSTFGVDRGRTIVWTMDWFLVWSEVLSVWKGLIRDRQFRAHFERTRCFERNLMWSEDILVWDGLIRGYFRLARSDQRHFRKAPQPGFGVKLSPPQTPFSTRKLPVYNGYSFFCHSGVEFSLCSWSYTIKMALWKNIPTRQCQWAPMNIILYPYALVQAGSKRSWIYVSLVLIGSVFVECLYSTYPLMGVFMSRLRCEAR